MERPVLHGHALDELHRHEDLIAECAHVVDRDDIGVRELGHGLSFADQPGAALVIAGARLQELQSDLAVEVRIVGCVDDTYGPSTDALEQDIAADACTPGEGTIARKRTLPSGARLLRGSQRLELR